MRLLLVSVLLCVACVPGDGIGYQVLVENNSPQDVVLTFHGMRIEDAHGQPLGAPATLAYLARAGGDPVLGPWVLVQPTGSGWADGRIDLYAKSCDSLAQFTVKPGSYVLTVADGVSPSIEPYRESTHFDSGLPELPRTQPCPSP